MQWLQDRRRRNPGCITSCSSDPAGKTALCCCAITSLSKVKGEAPKWNFGSSHTIQEGVWPSTSVLILSHTPKPPQYSWLSDSHNSVQTLIVLYIACETIVSSCFHNVRKCIIECDYIRNHFLIIILLIYFPNFLEVSLCPGKHSLSSRNTNCTLCFRVC